jgi:hypothetical protein
LCSPPPLMVTSSPLGTFPKYMHGLSLLMFTKMGFGSNLLMLTKKYSIVGETILYFIWTEPSFFELSSVFFSTLWKPNNYAPIEKVLILWFCWTYNIVLHSLLHVQSTASSRVSSKCSNSTMQLIKIHVGEKFRSRCELFMGNMYSLASKGKGHKPVETLCVRWLPWMLRGKHIESCVGAHPNQCGSHSST